MTSEISTVAVLYQLRPGPFVVKNTSECMKVHIFELSDIDDQSCLHMPV